MRLALNDAQYVSKLVRSCIPAGLPTQKAIGVALSGGPDSTALAHLLHENLKACSDGDVKQVTALIVDHGLRAESSTEARQVSHWATELGILCEIQKVPWGEPPFPSFPEKTSVEASARTARIILFKRFLRKHAMQHLYLAHHLDDQVETAFLRQARGTASALALPGLQAYSNLPLLPEAVGPEDEALALIRPLLAVPKSELIEYCKHHRLKYVTDPTNIDPDYTARNALRANLQALQNRLSPLQTEAGPLHALRQWTHRLSKRKNSLEAEIQVMISKVQFDTPVKSACTFDPTLFRRNRPETRQVFLARLARMISPETTTSTISPSNMVDLDKSIFGFHRRREQPHIKVTPGAKVMFTRKRRKGNFYWIVSRQPLRPTERAILSCKVLGDKWTLWDGRFWIRSDNGGVPEAGNRISVVPHGNWVLPTTTSSALITSRIGCYAGRKPA